VLGAIEGISWSTLLFAKADVIGLQEVLSDQFDFLSTSLAQEFDLVGVGRDDGKREGEFAPIAFRKAKFKCIEWGTIWLSETPNIVGSKYLLGRSNCCGCVGCCVAPCTNVRIATWARLKPRQQVDGSPCPEIIVANTHLDSKSEDARTFGCQLIDSKLREITKKGEGLFFLGDLNFERGAEGYQYLLGSPGWRDSWVDIEGQKVSPAEVERNGVTFHDFGRSSVGRRIDIILYLPRNGSTDIQSLDSNVVRSGEDGEKSVFASDHYLLASKFSLTFE